MPCVDELPVVVLISLHFSGAQRTKSQSSFSTVPLPATNVNAQFSFPAGIHILETKRVHLRQAGRHIPLMLPALALVETNARLLAVLHLRESPFAFGQFSFVSSRSTHIQVFG